MTKEIFITDQIFKPCDGYTYKIFPFNIPNGCEVVIEQSGGSFETISHKIENDALDVICPVWAKNPYLINIGYQFKNN